MATTRPATKSPKSAESQRPPTLPKKVRLIKEIVATTKGAPIEGRIKSKGSIKNWQTATGTGKLFSFVVKDTTGEMGALVVDEMAEKWYDVLQVGKCYRISNYGTKKSDEKYKNTDHACEIPISKVSTFLSCKYT